MTYCSTYFVVEQNVGPTLQKAWELKFSEISSMWESKGVEQDQMCTAL